VRLGQDQDTRQAPAVNIVRQRLRARRTLQGSDEGRCDRTASAQQCLHGGSERSAEQARREQALKMAHQINAAEMRVVPQTPGSRNPRAYQFLPLEQLPSSLPVPPGFAVKFLTDGTGYMFSIRDTKDPCHYTIFSDQDRWIYETTPSTSVVIVPATTQ
jgi:hypothetical protein